MSRRLLRWALLLLLLGWVAVPLAWVLLSSIKPPIDQRTARIVPFVQFTPTLDPWRHWLTDERLLNALADSFIVAVASTAIALTLGSLAGYGLARFTYRRWKNDDLFVFFLSQRVLPPIVTALPFYILSRWSGTFDSLGLLIVVHATLHLPLVVLLMRGAFRDLPRELEESAAVEGCSPLRCFVSMALPLASPSLLATTLIVFSFSWNEFLFGLLLTSRKVMPLPRFIQMSAETDWGVQLDAVAVVGLIAIVPPILCGLLGYRFLGREPNLTTSH